MIHSVPGELTRDHLCVVDLARKNQSWTSISHLKQELGWESDRSQKALDHLVKDGLAWIDMQCNTEILYYFPSLFLACTNSETVVELE